MQEFSPSCCGWTTGALRRIYIITTVFLEHTWTTGNPNGTLFPQRAYLRSLVLAIRSRKLMAAGVWDQETLALCWRWKPSAATAHYTDNSECVLVNTARMGRGSAGVALTQQDPPGVNVSPLLARALLKEPFFRVSFTSWFLLPSGRESGEAPAYLTTCLRFRWRGKPVKQGKNDSWDSLKKASSASKIRYKTANLMASCDRNRSSLRLSTVCSTWWAPNLINDTTN